jgi:hypothetical protein
MRTQSREDQLTGWYSAREILLQVSWLLRRLDDLVTVWAQDADEALHCPPCKWLLDACGCCHVALQGHQNDVGALLLTKQSCLWVQLLACVLLLR